ncbi:MAG TPA: LysR family transcriptional regulator [Burkholderiaceae bacterium]
MYLRWINDLMALAETRNFSRAAELRHVTQSALSRRIRSLEDWVGAELINRGTFPLELTPAGELFCERGAAALKDLLEVRAEIRQDTRMPGRAIQIRAAHTLSMTFLPKWIKEIRRGRTQFNARVVAENVLDAVTALSEGSCELMFCYHHASAPILLDAQKFDCLSWGCDKLIPVSAASSAGRPLFRLPGRANSPVPYLAYTGTSFLGRVVEVILRQAGTPAELEVCYEADMAMLLMNMAREGYGVAWVPESAAQVLLEDKTLARAGGPEWSVQLEIRSYRSLKSGNPALEELWADMKKTGTQVGAGRS